RAREHKRRRRTSDGRVMIVLIGLALYAAAGIAVAAAFVAFGVTRVLPEPVPVSVGARILIFPGAAALWPYVLVRWLTSSRCDRRPVLFTACSGQSPPGGPRSASPWRWSCARRPIRRRRRRRSSSREHGLSRRAVEPDEARLRRHIDRRRRALYRHASLSGL